jgi:uncharacterized membrane protein YidH (DUF202 family)
MVNALFSMLVALFSSFSMPSHSSVQRFLVGRAAIIVSLLLAASSIAFFRRCQVAARRFAFLATVLSVALHVYVVCVVDPPHVGP